MKPLDELFSGLLELRGKKELYSDEWKEIDKLIKLYFQHQQEKINKLKQLVE